MSLSAAKPRLALAPTYSFSSSSTLSWRSPIFRFPGSFMPFLVMTMTMGPAPTCCHQHHCEGNFIAVLIIFAKMSLPPDSSRELKIVKLLTLFKNDQNIIIFFQRNIKKYFNLFRDAGVHNNAQNTKQYSNVTTMDLQGNENFFLSISCSRREREFLSLNLEFRDENENQD